MSSETSVSELKRDLSRIINQAAYYDAQYLALAEQQNCEFWTADARLYNHVTRTLPYVRRLE